MHSHIHKHTQNIELSSVILPYVCAGLTGATTHVIEVVTPFLKSTVIVSAMATDSVGNVYVGGTTQYNGTVCGKVYSSSSSVAGFLAKYSPQGVCLWSLFFGPKVFSATEFHVQAIETTSGDSLLLVANFYGVNTIWDTTGVSQDFGSSSLVFHMLVGKWSSTGQLLWVKEYGQSAHVRASDLALDASENIFLCGSYNTADGNSVDLGGGPLPLGGGTVGVSFSANQAFVAKFSSNGVYVWAKSYGVGEAYKTDGVSAISVAVDNSGGLVVLGSYPRSANFGGATFTSKGSSDVFLARYSVADGAHIWSKSFGGIAGGELPGAVITDSSSNIYITGAYTSEADFGGPLPLETNYDYVLQQNSTGMFLSSYDSTGKFRWNKGFAGPYVSQITMGRGLALDKSNNLVATGLAGSANFDSFLVGYGFDGDAFVAKMSSSTGDVLWVHYWGAHTFDQTGNRVVISQVDNHVWAAGTVYFYPVDFGLKNISVGAAFLIDLAP